MGVMSQMIIRNTGHRRRRMLCRIDIDPKDVPLLAGGDVEPDVGQDDSPIIESGYSSTSDYSSPIVRKSRDITSMSGLSDPTKDPLLGRDPNTTDPTLMDDADDLVKCTDIVPSAVVDYYNETALTSKQRNKLPNSEFGVPRLRAYPLNDRAHVKQAVRMFSHCKDPEDRKVLAANIFKAAKKHDVDLNLSKTSPLYPYAPAVLQEAAGAKAGSQTHPAISLGTSIGKRTRDEVIKEHLMINRSFYNNLFYGPEYVKSAKALMNFKFLDFFYPDVGRMSFQARLECVCGGLAGGGSRDEIYESLGIRSPLCTDFTKELGWCTSDQSDSAVDIFIRSSYDSMSNWFKVDLSDDPDHTLFCLRLYSVMGEIFLDPNFNQDIHLTDKHLALLMDWNQRVGYHYDLYLDASTESERMREIQYLFDMYWTYTDNPHYDPDINVNLIAMLHSMPCVESLAATSINEANVAGELVTVAQCNAYLVHDLGMDDSLYLLPSTLEYPIISKESIRLAMDLIWRVDKEQRKEFSENLNRKYKEYGCTFSISVDHPYAPYADKNIVSNMTRVLLEGGSSVDDEGTSTDTSPASTQPWYKRLDTVRGVAVNLLDNKELGPNNKKHTSEPPYDHTDTFK